jgi:hypothetical protein
MRSIVNDWASAFSSALHIVNRSSSVLSGSFNALLLSLFDLQFCMTWVNISLSVLAEGSYHTTLTTTQAKGIQTKYKTTQP